MSGCWGHHQGILSSGNALVMEGLLMQLLTTDTDSEWGGCLLVMCVNVLHIDYVAGCSSAANVAACC